MRIRAVGAGLPPASRASTTGETAARVMNGLARNGIVKRDEESLMIADIRGLREIVENLRGYQPVLVRRRFP